MERFTVLGTESGLHDTAIWALTPIPEAQRAEHGAFLTGGEDGRLRSWRFGPAPPGEEDDEDEDEDDGDGDGDDEEPADDDDGDGDDGDAARAKKKRKHRGNGIASRIRAYSGHTLPVVSAAVAAQAAVAASTSLDGHVRIWALGSDDAAACTVISQTNVTDAWDVDLLPDGSRAVVCGAQSSVQVLDCTGGMMEKHYLSGGDGSGGGGGGGGVGGGGAGARRGEDARRDSTMAMSVAISEDGALAAVGGSDGSVTVYDIGAGTQVCAAKRRHGGAVRSVAFVSGERATVASAADDQLVNLYDATSGETTGSCRGHDALVFGVAASADGRYLASGGADNTVRVWDRGLREQIFMHREHAAAVWSTAFVGGDRILSVSDDGNICFIDSTNADVVT